MIIKSEKGKVIRKIVRTRSGELVVAVFLVAERDGELQVALLSARPLRRQERLVTAGARESTANNLCLSGACNGVAPAAAAYRCRTFVSPYVNLFEFLSSQNIRGPSGL